MQRNYNMYLKNVRTEDIFIIGKMKESLILRTLLRYIINMVIYVNNMIRNKCSIKVSKLQDMQTTLTLLNHYLSWYCGS